MGMAARFRIAIQLAVRVLPVMGFCVMPHSIAAPNANRNPEVSTPRISPSPDSISSTVSPFAVSPYVASLLESAVAGTDSKSSGIWRPMRTLEKLWIEDEGVHLVSRGNLVVTPLRVDTGRKRDALSRSGARSLLRSPWVWLAGGAAGAGLAVGMYWISEEKASGKAEYIRRDYPLGSPELP